MEIFLKIAELLDVELTELVKTKKSQKEHQSLLNRKKARLTYGNI
jgi:hypothetical protein